MDSRKEFIMVMAILMMVVFVVVVVVSLLAGLIGWKAAQGRQKLEEHHNATVATMVTVLLTTLFGGVAAADAVDHAAHDRAQLRESFLERGNIMEERNQNREESILAAVSRLRDDMQERLSGLTNRVRKVEKKLTRPEGE